MAILKSNRPGGQTLRLGSALWLPALLLLLLPLKMQAQTADKAAYDKAVTEINCATIRFIHREQGRGEKASSMDCSGFESINASIPADEKGTTGGLAKSIDAYRNKFSPSKPLAEQLEAVKKFAYEKINAKQRKGNIDEYRSELENIISSVAAKAAPAGAGSASEIQRGDTSMEHEADALETEAPAEKAAGGSNTLGWISLLLSLGALALGGMAFMRVRNMQPGASTVPAELSNNDKEKINRALTLSRDADDRSRALENSLRALSGAAIPEAAPSTSREPAPRTETPRPPAPAEEPLAYSPPPAQARPDTARANPLSDFAHDDTGPADDRIQLKKMGNLQEQRDDAAAADMNIGAGDALTTHEPVIPPVPPRPEPYAPQPAVNKYNEPGENKPFFLYAPANPLGQCSENELRTAPASDSVYELELYPNTPDKAFFSLLSFPEVIRDVMRHPGEKLDAYCSYHTPPTPEDRTIFMLEEGIMARHNGMWHVSQKSRISFSDPDV